MESLLHQFDLNITDSWMILVGALFFVVLWRLLSVVLFEPYLRLVEAREAATTGAESDIAVHLAETQRLEDQHATGIQEARVKIQAERLAELAAARARVAKRVEAAQSEAEGALIEGRKRIAQEAGELKAGALSQAKDLAQLLLQKIQTGVVH